MPKKKNRKLSVPTHTSPKTPTRPRFLPLKHLFAIGLMVAVALAAYANSFNVPFQFDDLPNISQYPFIQIKSLSFDQLEQMIKNVYQESIRIFVNLTFALNYYFGKYDVFDYHLVNLLIHIASGIFLYFFLLLTLNLPSLRERYGPIAFPTALFSSLLFLSHPVQTQSVTYIVQRFTSMAAMFYLLAMFLYVKGRLSRTGYRLFYFGGAIISYLLGLFSKEYAAILPFFILLYEFYFFQNLNLNLKATSKNVIPAKAGIHKLLTLLDSRLRGSDKLGIIRGSLKEKKGFTRVIGVVLFIGILMILIWGNRYFDLITEKYKLVDFTLSERLLTQFRVVLYYVTLLLYPHPSRLNLDYDFPISRGILDPPSTLISILIVLGLIGYSLWVARKKPLLSFFILWYFGNLLIESSILPLEMAYEHRLYLPSIGPIVLFVILVERGWGKIKKVKGEREKGKGEIEEAEGSLKQNLPLWIFFVLITFLFCLGAYQRNAIWKDPITLWEDCVKKSPNKDRPYYNLGLGYYNMGRYKEAVDAYQRAIHLKPNYPDSYNNLALAYKELRSYQKAVEAFQEAIRIKPNFQLALVNLGLTYKEIDRLPEAIDVFKRVIELKPKDAELYNYLGIVYKKMGRYQEAIEVYQNGIRLKPGDPNLYNNLGLAFYAMGKLKEALGVFEKAIRLKPNDEEFYYNLGVTYSTLGNHLSGIEAYMRALQIKPGDTRSRFNLGLSYMMIKRPDMALEQARILMDYDKEQANKLMKLIKK